MASNSLESSRGNREPAKAAEAAKPAAEEKAEPAPAKSVSFKPWLPLVAAAVAMPALAYATTHFVLLPQLQRGLAQAGPGAAQEAPAESGAKTSGKTGSEKSKVTVSLSKILVNVAGTMGTRYLMTSVTLVGNTPDFAGKINDDKDQLLDLATGVLGSKTIADLEKPGARNVIRAELLTVFNNALGGPVVQEIYITEMAIQ
jgi:flagellar FliL protein